jgi:hypothetical protein
MAVKRRQAQLSTLAERESFVARGLDFQEAELAAAEPGKPRRPAPAKPLHRRNSLVSRNSNGNWPAAGARRSPCCAANPS